MFDFPIGKQGRLELPLQSVLQHAEATLDNYPEVAFWEVSPHALND